MFARFGSPRVRRGLRLRRLAANPYYWLASRDRLPRLVGVVLFGAVSALWCCLFFWNFHRAVANKSGGVQRGAVHGVRAEFDFSATWWRWRQAAGSARTRRSGALELLLVTQLSRREMFAGQRRALFQHFKVPMTVLLLFNAALLWLVNGPDPVHASAGGVFALAPKYTVLLAGGMLMLILDFAALNWARMWLGAARAGASPRCLVHAGGGRPRARAGPAAAANRARRKFWAGRRGDVSGLVAGRVDFE